MHNRQGKRILVLLVLLIIVTFLTGIFLWARTNKLTQIFHVRSDTMSDFNNKPEQTQEKPRMSEIVPSLVAWGGGQVKVSLTFPGEQPKTIFDKDTRETPETFCYIDVEDNQKKCLNQYRHWTDVVIRNEKAAPHEVKGEPPFFQRVRASLYAPKGELLFDTTSAGDSTNAIFYDFYKSQWFGLTDVGKTGQKWGEPLTMKIGFDQPYGAAKPEPIFTLSRGETRATVYAIPQGFLNDSMLILYETPVQLALVFTEETDCVTLDIDPGCDFYQKDLFEDFDKEFLETVIEVEILRSVYRPYDMKGLRI